MNLELIREYCLSKKGVTEEYPFDEVSPVYKVIGKIFLIASIEHPPGINIKAAPEDIVDMRERYESVVPGYHMNKTHWNTVYLDGTIPSKLILEWIDNSYNLIAAKLKKADRDKLVE
jgi:predicted DNA-binding protein (MmcQ/YjbR family)